MTDKLFAGHAAPAPGDYIRLSVRDTGVGIDPQTLALIFQPYFSTKLWGRGLGLAILLEIVKKHHGGVQVHSKPGRGTTFLVYLPAHTPHTSSEYTAETVQTTRPGTTRPPHPKLDNGGI
jgi:signal transduction histidine kinase